MTRVGQRGPPIAKEKKTEQAQGKQGLIVVRDEKEQENLKEEEEFGNRQVTLRQLIEQAEEMETVMANLDDQHRDSLGKLRRGHRRAKDEKERGEYMMRRVRLQEEGLQEARHGIHVLADLIRCLARQQQLQHKQQLPHQPGKKGASGAG